MLLTLVRSKANANGANKCECRKYDPVFAAFILFVDSHYISDEQRRGAWLSV